jgi:hypothetical protein
MNLLTQPFVKAALDPNLIAGIYNTCDQWCLYCPATSRCLAYRCRPPGAKEEERQDIYANIAERLYESLGTVKAMTEADGKAYPELDALLAADPRKTVVYQPIDDPLEAAGRRYAKLARSYLLSRPDFPCVMKRRPDGPAPLEVFAWFYTLIAAKIYRAIISGGAAARGDAKGGVDAVASAKVALLGIDRSRAAIQALQQEDDDARLDAMSAHLRRLSRDVEARFPDARTFVRVGLDPT